MNIEDAKAACMLPDCQRKIVYPATRGRAPLFCQNAHAVAFRRHRARLEARLATLQDQLNGPDLTARAMNELRIQLNKTQWHLARYPDLGFATAPPTTPA